MIPRRIAMNILNTQYHIERDALCASVLRVTNGFHPPSVVREMKVQLNTIADLVQQIEVLVDKKDDTLVPSPLRLDLVEKKFELK